MLKLGFITRNLGYSSEVWMYRQLIGISKFSTKVLTWNYFNQDQFPFSNTTTISQISKPLSNIRAFRFFQKKWHFLNNFTKPTPFWQEITKWLDHIMPDILLCQFGPVGIELLPFALERNIPTVCHFHGRDLSAMLKTDAKYKKELLQHLDKFAAIVVVGSHQKQWMKEQGISPEKVHLIPCGVPVDEFEYVERKPKQKTTFVAISRLVEKKGLEYTIKAFDLARNNIEARLDIIGDGPLKNKITDIAQKSKYSSNIHLIGELPPDKVKEILYQADIFVQHSIISSDGDTEGSPVSIAEAAAAGLPVISTWHAGIPDLVKNNITGFLVKEKDYNDMADKMILLASDPETRKIMGVAAREHMLSKFNTPDQVDKLENVLINVCK